MTRRHISVVATSPPAVEAGLQQASGGGNAVDAAIAAAVLASVSEPGIVSPMAGAFVNIWAPGRDPVVIDGNVEMPGRGLPPEAFGGGLERVEMEYGGGISIHGGHGSVATPGMLAALADAHAGWGSLPWAELLQPSIDLARTGYRLGSAAAYYLTYSGTSLFAWHPQTRAWLAQGGDDPVPVAGAVMRSPDLAASLELIARHGTGVLYGGELGEVVADDMALHGGLITRADLADYRTVRRTPIRARLADWDVALNPGPSIGGPVLTAMLRLLSAGTGGAEEVLRAQHIALGYRNRFLDPAEDLHDATAELLAILDDHGPEGLAALCHSPDTVHISAADSDGLVCAITASAGYGSGVTTPGTGLMLNNCLGEPELNRLGLHALPPGTRLASNMAPTTARHRDGRALAIGSPGADRITTALAQVLTAYCLRGLSLDEAVRAPRMHLAYDDRGPHRVVLEADARLEDVAARSGLPVERHADLHMFFGGVGAALREADGSVRAVGDPRRDAAVGTT